MTTNKLNDTILKNLYSDNEVSIEKALEDIAQNGNSAYIPSLIDILNSSESIVIKNRISKILAEVKHTNAVPLLINAIEDKKLKNVQEILVRVCWENGLDFTNHFTTFVDLLITGEYMTAFEAYTVIENSEGRISKTSMLEYTDKLKEALPSIGEERQPLIHHIIQLLPGIVEA